MWIEMLPLMKADGIGEAYFCPSLFSLSHGLQQKRWPWRQGQLKWQSFTSEDPGSLSARKPLYPPYTVFMRERNKLVSCLSYVIWGFFSSVHLLLSPQHWSLVTSEIILWAAAAAVKISSANFRKIDVIFVHREPEKRGKKFSRTHMAARPGAIYKKYEGGSIPT